YVLKYGTSREIKYVDVHNYCIELNENKELHKIPSESYWRKKDRIGRKLIDQVNITLSHKLKRDDNDYELESLFKIIETKVSDKKLKTTIFNELKSKHNKIERLERELSMEKDSLVTLKKFHNDSKILNKRQQDLISQVFHHFLNQSTNENSEFFDSALKSTFSNPLDYLSILKQEKKQKQNNVSDFFKERLKK